MDALSLYRAGQLDAAIRALGEELKKQPLDTKRRTFLFELLCFAGEYDRAEKQLNVLSDTSREAAAGALLYRAGLHAERTRQQMFERKELPLGSALERSVAGALNGKPFSKFEDTDPRLGSHLEVFIAGSYTWIPISYIEHLEVPAPAKLRDLLWTPAILRTTADFRLQDLGEVLLPVLAPLSFKHPDESVKLGRTTVWEQDDDYGEIPFGRKLFTTGEEETSLLEMRDVSWNHESRREEIASA
jgi:type VI secretion system protein ImpE